MLRRIKQSFEDQQMLVEAFVLFLGVAAILVGGEFGMFAFQGRLAAAGVSFFAPEIFLDAYVPFTPEFAWAYWAYFPMLGLSVWFPKTRHELARQATGLITLHYIGYAIFLLYPSAMKRLPITCDTVSCDLVGATYLLDPGYGIFPSLHVAASVYMMQTAFYFRSRARWGVAALSLAIILATVFIKQHYLVDVPAGILVGYLGGKLGWKLADFVRDRLQSTVKIDELEPAGS